MLRDKQRGVDDAQGSLEAGLEVEQMPAVFLGARPAIATLAREAFTA